MAFFASYRRSGWVRLLVLILCALFIFATLGAPPAQALGVESVAVFGLASVLSAATAALGFKLSSNEQGQATLQKMVQDFKTVAWATGFVLVGSKLNGLQNGMDYIKMQVQNGKTYLDSRVFAWVQQWLAQNGVYDAGGVVSDGSLLDLSSDSTIYTDSLSKNSISFSQALEFIGASSLDFSSNRYNVESMWNSDSLCILFTNDSYFPNEHNYFVQYGNSSSWPLIRWEDYSLGNMGASWKSNQSHFSAYYSASSKGWQDFSNSYLNIRQNLVSNHNVVGIMNHGNYWSVSANNTGLSGTDTLGKDVVDLTLDQILEKLKEWAQDWYDAGADSATNAAAGAKDLPLTVATGAATANPSIAEDGPLVWFPPFSIPIPNLRTGETDTKTVDQGKENASAVETSTVDVAENQTVIDSLVNWALSYISPDTGLFSKFPLCVPYDAYLLVTSSLGVDAVGSDSIFGASPGDLDGVVSQDIETYSDFQPIINIKHDFELDGKTYPVELTIDLTPWQPLVTFFREGMALLLVAELIGSEFKRIRGH